jgi:hypothetical protein
MHQSAILSEIGANCYPIDKLFGRWIMFLLIPPMNAAMTAGDFLIAKQVSNSTSSFVCIIREVVLPSELRVTSWLTCEQLEA